MEFCEECGTLLSTETNGNECEQCQGTNTQTENVSTETDRGSSSKSQSAALADLPTTKSGSVKKADAMEWLSELDRPSKSELRSAVVEKPNDFSGSTFPTEISTVRLTGDPQFIETIAGLFSWFVDMEDYSRRVEINLQKTEDKETEEKTGNYALYLSVAERG